MDHGREHRDEHDLGSLRLLQVGGARQGHDQPRRGEKVSAEEVENFGYQLPAVMQAAAVAMPDADLGERVCLYVVPRAGGTVDLDDVRSVMDAAGVAEYKRPEQLTETSLGGSWRAPAA